MRLNKLKGAVLASVLVLSIGVVAVKAAPSSEKQKETSTVKSTENVGVTATTPEKAITVSTSVENVKPTTGIEETTSKVTPIVVSSTKYKVVTLITKADIKELTGIELTYKNTSSVYKQLKKSTIWEAAGYSANDAKLIAARFNNNYNQAVGILKKLAKNSKLNLKVVVLNKPTYQNAYIGVSGYNGNTETSKPSLDQEGNTNVVVTTTPEVTQSNLKELEINIDYKNGSVELEYSVKLDGSIKAEYQNDFTKEEIQGKAAKEKIEGILEGLDIKENNQTTILNHILTKLNLDKGYKEFQFEATYSDGKEIEFKM